MIHFLNLDQFTKGLKPVARTEYFVHTGEFHPEGLFSEQIFGVIDSVERKTSFSYIDLFVKVIHPSGLRVLKQLDRSVEKFISTEENFVLDSDKKLQVDDGGVTGITEFMKIFPKIKFRTESSMREKLFVVVTESYKNGTLFVDKLPVIPPDFRPAFQDEKSGDWSIDPLNDYYLNILRKSLQLKTSVGSGPLFDLLNYELQRAINSHDDFIRTLIQKKQGIIRSQLLGKRTDFSGRAVITPSPDLKIGEIGIPLRLAVSLFEPFLIHRLLYSGQVDREVLEREIQGFTGLDLSVDSVKKVMKAITARDDIPKALYDIFFEATEGVMLGRVVLAKRDPVLHVESVRAFKPKLVTGNAIQLCTLQVDGFNADFDGDQVAVFHPLTNEAQQEAASKMLRGESGESSNAVTFSLTKEMCVGLFTITKSVELKKSPVSASEEDLEEATDPYIPVVYRRKPTTMGKAIFNSCFPRDFPFYDKQVTKSVVNDLIPQVIEKYGQEEAVNVFSKLERVGFKFSTIMAPGFTLSDIEIPDEIYVLKRKMEGATTEEATALLQQMEEILVEHLKGTGLYDLIESGSSKGGWQPVMQLLVAKGIIANPQGEVLDPIKGSFSDGLTNKEYFEASAGARKGIIDRVINTADTGYMSRRLAFVLNSVEVHPDLRDCHTNRTLTLRLVKDLIYRLSGRFVLSDGKVEEFKSSDYKAGDVINLRSPVYCKSSKLCHICYGKLIQRHKTPYVGVLAAQVIGERGTQLIMRSFHLGGKAEIIKRDILQEVAANDPVVDLKKMLSYLSQMENQLACLKPCKVIIDLYNYTPDSDFIRHEDHIWFASLISRIEFEDLTFNLVLDYPVNLQIQRMEEFGKERIELEYDRDSVVLEVPLETQELKQQIHYVDRLLGGREIFKDVDHLFGKLFKVYGPISTMDLVHLEVLLSQCMRDKQDKNLPARLGRTWNPMLSNMKDVVFNSSFLQGLAFENVGRAIQSGLVSEDMFGDSVIEKVMTGTLVEKKTE